MMNSRDEDVAKAIRLRSVSSILAMFFEKNQPVLKQGFKTETELWDYKCDVPHIGKQHANAWAHLAKDIIAFHNQRGGVLFFGISDSFAFNGASERLDSKLLNDQLRKYIPDTLWIEFHREFIQENQRYLGIALVVPHSGSLVRFTSDAPEYGGKQLFFKTWSAMREGDSSRVLQPSEVEELNRTTVKLHVGQRYYVDEPSFRVPAPDYLKFIYREQSCTAIEAALIDQRTSVAHVIGIGGVGKTALATWAAIRAYEQKQFSFIVFLTAKDRELTTTGIAALQPEFTSFESLLNTIADVLQFTEFKALPVEEKEEAIRMLLEKSGGLLYVDNLETVDDPRIIKFLDTLPVGVRALVTSRRLTVRVAVYPITVGPMDDNEICAFARSLEVIPRCRYVEQMTDDDLIKIGRACDHIPLAIRWVLTKSTDGAEALREADAILATGRRGEELLEFSFRRVFDQMNNSERTLLEVLSLFTQPQPTEVLLVGSGLKLPDLQDALSTLLDDVIVQRSFDTARNDDAYSLLPITRAFVYNEVTQHEGREAAIRNRLSDYFEAKDVKNPDDRVVIRAVRQSADTSDTALVDLARSARRRGDLASAQDLFNQAITRNPRSWRAYRELAELHRHEFRNVGQALRNYEQAAANAPKDTFERARIFREWGIVLRDCGQPNAAAEAEGKLIVSLELNSRDLVAITALAQLYDRRGASFKVIELCEPWATEVYGRAKETMLPLLLKAYQLTGNMLKAAEVRDRLRD